MQQGIHSTEKITKNILYFYFDGGNDANGDKGWDSVIDRDNFFILYICCLGMIVCVA